MDIRAVIFDLDGTLLDTIEDLADAMNAVLGRRGFPTHDALAYKRFVGDGLELLVERALPADGRAAAALRECVEDFGREYAGCWDRKTRPYEGVMEMLRALASRGLQLAVLSNKPHAATLQVVRALLGGVTFDDVRGAMPGVPRKPDPAAALAIAARIGVPPRACLCVGDSGVDMRMAAAAGMTSVGALWGFRGEAELRAGGATFLAAAPRDVMALPLLGP
jgi:phosphoglycolate phosphatase